MSVDPVFCGKIHVTAVKNEKWFWYDYKTSPKTDDIILDFAKKVCPKDYTWDRQSVSQKSGDEFRSILEDSIGAKLDIPDNTSYSVTYSENYNPVKKKNSYSILLFCQEKFLSKDTFKGDRTAIDIYI